MDPLAALSLAASVVQFVDFGLSIAKEGTEVYHSLDGATIQNATLEYITKDLQSLMERLKIQPPPVGTTFTPAQTSLNNLVKKCSETAKEILDKLEKVKARKRSVIESLRAAFLNVWSKKGIDELCKHLEGYQIQLNTHLLGSLR